MKTYLVGGAVRDQLLDYPVQEKDWVVVGATPEEMLAQGFRPVGKDFPVFLHPQTHEEYALARTERKVRPGYTGFMFHASPEVTLEQDLQRRDLTINAIAQAEDGSLIDPFGGKEDLRKKILRHVSPAFVEDPVRILRVARFAARYHYLGFVVAPETMVLMQEMVKQGEVDALVPERVWQELTCALSEANPECFFEVLHDCDALKKLFPEIENIFPIKKVNKYNEIILTFSDLMLHLKFDEIKSFCQRYAVPKNFRELALIAKQQQGRFLQSKLLAAEEICALLYEADAWRRTQRFQQLLTLFTESQHIKMIKKAYLFARDITVADFLQQGLQGKALKEAIYQQRLQKINSAFN